MRQTGSSWDAPIKEAPITNATVKQRLKSKVRELQEIERQMKRLAEQRHRILTEFGWGLDEIKDETD